MINTENKIGWSRAEMAQKVALDIPDGSYVNLGIGIPELVADFVPEGRELIYQTENGLLGMGKVPKDGKKDRELVNAGKKYITAIPGAAYFHHADSFTPLTVSRSRPTARWWTTGTGRLPTRQRPTSTAQTASPARSATATAEAIRPP